MNNKAPNPVYWCICKETGAVSDIIQAHSTNQAATLWREKMESKGVEFYDIVQHKFKKVTK